MSHNAWKKNKQYQENDMLPKHSKRPEPKKPEISPMQGKVHTKHKTNGRKWEETKKNFKHFLISSQVLLSHI